MRSWIVPLARLCVVFGFAAGVGAQAAEGQVVKEKTTIPHPKPFFIQGDSTKPNVFITPASGTFAGSVAVTISYGDKCELPGPPTIKLNGQNITSQFTYTGGGGGPQCTGVTGQATGTIALRQGADTLLSTISNANLLTGGDTVYYTSVVPVHKLHITVAAGAMHAAPNSVATVAWTLTNLGNTTDTINVKHLCYPTSVLSNCYSTPDSIQGLAPGGTWSGTAHVSVSDSVGQLGRLRTIAFERTHSSVTDTTYTDITVQAPLGPGVVLSTVTPDVTRPRNKCLTIEIRPGIAYECGDLRAVHAMPGTRIYNKLRSPALIYNSNIATGVNAIGALVTFDPAKGTPDTVKATLTDSATGKVVGSRQWLGSYWVNGTTQRVTVRNDGEYGIENRGQRFVYTFTAMAIYNSLKTTQSFTATGAQLSTSEATSNAYQQILAGREYLLISQWLGANPWNSSKPVFWSNSEGDTRQYNAVPGDSLVWAAAGVDRPDTIKEFNGPTLYGAYRYAEHGALVHFDGHGNELEAIDRLGHSTRIVDTVVAGFNATAVDIPAPGATEQYILAFDSYGHRLDSIVVPSVSGQSRNVRFRYDTLNLYADTIKDPDGSFEVYRFANGEPHLPAYDLMTSYQDKHGTVMSFTYDSAFKLIKADVDTGASGLNQTWTFQPAESRGLTTPVAPDSAYTLVTGPRANGGGDSADVTRYWVNQWGEPMRIRDAHGEETEITRGNATYPSLATYVRYPNGRVVTETYDARGNPATFTDSSNSGATTRYTFDRVVDFMTQVVNPMGDQVNFAYNDTTGNMLWAQPGADSSRRLHFTYYPSTAAGSRLIASSTMPVEAPNADSLYYDPVLGNANATVTPKRYLTSILTDAIGRIIRVRTPIDSLFFDTATDSVHHKWRTDTSVYDAMDRVVLQESYGPSDSSKYDPAYSTEAYANWVIGPAEKTIVTTVYDTLPHDGLPMKIVRQASPDVNGIGTMTDSMVYDALGRLKQKFWPDQSSEFYTYDLGNNMIGKVTRRGDELAMYYDALNQLIKRVLPPPQDNTGPTLFHLAAVNANFESPLYPNCGTGLCLPGETATFQYDRVGNVTEADNQDATVSRTYWQYGPIRSDTLRIRAYTNGDFSQHVYGLNYTYDLDLHRLTLLHPTNIAPLGNSNVQTYTYDSLGRLSTIQDVLSPVFTYTYDKDGRISEVSSSSFGLAEHRQYDVEGRLASLVDSTKDTSSTSGTGSAVLHSNVYHYDARGNAIETDATQEVSHNNYSALGTMVHGIILPQPGPLKYVYDLDEEVYLPDAFGNAQWKWATTCPTCDSLSNAQHLYYEPRTARLDSATYHTTNQQINPPQSHYQSALYDHAGNRWFNTFQDSPNDVVFNVGATVSYYDAGDRLRVADRQTCFYDASVPGCVTNEQNLPFTEETRYEDYYYDALGRRVLLRSRDDVIKPCIVNATSTHPGCFGAIERTVYDGNHVLYEIRMPGDDSVPATELERDTGGVATYVGHDFLTPYGRVVYLHGLDLDDPLDLIRVGQDTSWPGPVAVAPRANWRGAYDGGVFTLPHPGSQFLCKNYSNGHNGESCFSQTWPAPRFGYWRQDQGNNSNMAPDPWIGSLVTGHRDVSNLLYLRNRYFDPQSQTFTQEDPAGLAGGLNAYGFAHGDPVNYSDPFGLCPPQDANNGPWCSSPGHWLLIHVFGVSGKTADEISEAGYDAAMAFPSAMAGTEIVAENAAAGAATVGTRYMGAGEAATVEQTGGTIPATNAAGQPRVIHYTTDEPTMSAQEAKTRYNLPKTPTHMCQFPTCNVQNSVPPEGTVAPGATQAATSKPITGASTPKPLNP